MFPQINKPLSIEKICIRWRSGNLYRGRVTYESLNSKNPNMFWKSFEANFNKYDLGPKPKNNAKHQPVAGGKWEIVGDWDTLGKAKSSSVSMVARGGRLAGGSGEESVFIVTAVMSRPRLHEGAASAADGAEARLISLKRLEACLERVRRGKPRIRHAT